MTSFIYSSLDTGQPSIRLVRLIGGHGPIQCEIFHSFLPAASSSAYSTMQIPYEALSYTWGGTEKTESIIANGRPMGVTNNLYLALSYLRRESTDRILWIDAICIDQDNSRERTHQVRQMARIYKRADTVILWLGQPTYATNVALESLAQLQNESKTASCRRWKKVDPRWRMFWLKIQAKLARRYPDLVSRQREGLRDLMSRPWFERVWVIQEVVNSRRAVVCCGNKSVSAQVFALSPHLFAVKPSGPVQAILDVMPGRSREESWWAQEHDLYTLLRKFRFSKASDPRDMVYALVRIASDSNLDEILVPDYEKTEREIIREVVLYLCNLDIESITDVSDGYWNAMVNDQYMTGFLGTIDSLYTAAMEQHLLVHRGTETTSFCIEQGRNLRITNEMINLALKKKKDEHDDKGVTTLELIIRRHADCAMLEYAAGHWRALPWLQFLLEHLSASVKITEAVMEAAARNPCSPEVLGLLLRDYGSEAPVTDSVLYLSACSIKADENFQVLLAARAHQIRLTPNLQNILLEEETPQKRAALKLLEENEKVMGLDQHIPPQSSDGDTRKSVEQSLEDFQSEWGGFAI